MINSTDLVVWQPPLNSASFSLSPVLLVLAYIACLALPLTAIWYLIPRRALRVSPPFLCRLNRRQRRSIKRRTEKQIRTIRRLRKKLNLPDPAEEAGKDYDDTQTSPLGPSLNVNGDVGMVSDKNGNLDELSKNDRALADCLAANEDLLNRADVFQEANVDLLREITSLWTWRKRDEDLIGKQAMSLQSQAKVCERMAEELENVRKQLEIEKGKVPATSNVLTTPRPLMIDTSCEAGEPLVNKPVMVDATCQTDEIPAAQPIKAIMADATCQADDIPVAQPAKTVMADVGCQADEIIVKPVMVDADCQADNPDEGNASYQSRMPSSQEISIVGDQQHNRMDDTDAQQNNDSHEDGSSQIDVDMPQAPLDPPTPSLSENNETDNQELPPTCNECCHVVWKGKCYSVTCKASEWYIPATATMPSTNFPAISHNQQDMIDHTLAQQNHDGYGNSGMQMDVDVPPTPQEQQSQGDSLTSPTHEYNVPGNTVAPHNHDNTGNEQPQTTQTMDVNFLSVAKTLADFNRSVPFPSGENTTTGDTAAQCYTFGGGNSQFEPQFTIAGFKPMSQAAPSAPPGYGPVVGPWNSPAAQKSRDHSGNAGSSKAPTGSGLNADGRSVLPLRRTPHVCRCGMPLGDGQVGQCSTCEMMGDTFELYD